MAIPEIVLREVPKLFERQLEAATDAMRAEALKLRDLGYPVGKLALPHQESAREDFERRFRAGLKQRNVLGAPVTGSLAEYIDQSIAERRPFRDKSRGFRDALIWRSVLELADDDQVIFITKNWKDFARSDKYKNELHRDLREDLKQRDHPPGRVCLVASLEDFIKEHVPMADQLKVAQDRLQTDAAWSRDLEDHVYNALGAMELGVWDKVTVVESEVTVEEVVVDDVFVDSFDIVAAYETEEEGLVSVEIRVDATLSFSLVTDLFGADWLAEAGGVELEQTSDSVFYGITGGRRVVVIFRADFDLATKDVGELEKVVAVDADNEELLARF